MLCSIRYLLWLHGRMLPARGPWHSLCFLTSPPVGLLNTSKSGLAVALYGLMCVWLLYGCSVA